MLKCAGARLGTGGGTPTDHQAYNDELAELRRAERIPDDSCAWVASLRAKAAMSPQLATQYADLAQQRHDQRVLEITSQIQSALTRRISWPDLDNPATARDEIPRVYALLDQLWCHDANAAMKAQTDVEAWAALREKGISDEQTCRATPTCMGARIAVPLCQAIAIRRAAMRRIAQERANPAGVDLNTLHELGQQAEENDAIAADLKARYAAVSRTRHSATLRATRTQRPAAGTSGRADRPTSRGRDRGLHLRPRRPMAATS